MSDDTGDGRDAGDGVGWEALLSDLARRRSRARAMGDPTRLEKRRAEGRLNARERIAALLDEDSFVEIGTLVGGIRPPGESPTPAIKGQNG